MLRSWLTTPLALLICACGNSAGPAAPSPPSGEAAPASVAPGAGPAAAAPPAAAPEPEAAARPRKPFPIHSSCTEVVTVAFGEDPRAASAGRRTVAPNSAIDGPRDAEGKQTVWLLDATGEPLVKVNITRGMKQLEVGRSCRTLDAR